jgi:hypothetical protein
MTRRCYLSPHQLQRLDVACIPIREAYDETPYLVGSSMVRGDYRDIDIRMMLDDERWDTMFETTGACDDGALYGDPLWTLTCITISEWLSGMTDMLIDFQIQRRTEANATYGDLGEHPRNPLGKMRAFSGGATRGGRR